MSAITTRFSPFRDVFRIHDEINRFFDSTPRLFADPSPLSVWAPPVDVYEDEEGITLRAELPGIDPNEVDLSIEDNTLTLRGERKLENEDKQDKYRRIERVYGSFSRTFTLPATVDATKVQADYKNGVLTVNLPRKEETRPRQIPVKVDQA